MINIGDFFMFQPIEIDNENISLFERKVPLDYKRKYLEFTLPEEIPSYADEDKITPQEVKVPQSKNAVKQKSKRAVRSVTNNEKYDKNT